MANILGSLGAAAYNLGAFGQALAAVQNNVGNATTPGYARQRVFLEALPFVVSGGLSGGVKIARVESVRDRFLDFQVIAALQRKTHFEKLAQTLTQIEPLFPISGELSIGATLDNFLNSFQALSASPGDFNLREGVLQAARTAANAIRTSYNGLTSQRATLDQEARGVVDEINSLAAELVAVNRTRAQIGAFSAGESATATRLTQILERLGELVEYRLVTQEDGSLTVVLPGGEPLVAGAFAFPLTAFPTGPRLEIRSAQGNDLSGSIGGGQLGAVLAARNQNIPRYLAQLDQLAGTLADAVNGQLARGVDLAGQPGKPLFQYTSQAFTGAGRTAGDVGATTPAPPVSVTLNFTGGVTGTITAILDSFFVAAAPPSGLASGDTVTVNFSSADGAINTSITTAPLTAGDATAVLAARLNDQTALNAQLAGKISFRDEGGLLKAVLSDSAGQGFTFTASASNPGFRSGLESGGTLGGHSAQEIVDALNAQVALDANLSAAGVRFSVADGEVRVDGSVSFTFTAADSASGTGFASGLGGTFTAGGSPAAATFAAAPLGNREIAAGTGFPAGNENALALARLASEPLVAGFTFTQFYARVVFGVGEDTRQATSAFTTQNQILLEAQNLRDALSGVSLDEEAVRLVEFQRAYEATSRVIAVLDSLADEVIRLLRSR
jgi:flagellar hook-associated protein 1 FlgK